MHKNGQILVVDDDLEDHIILRDYFTTCGYDESLLSFQENGKKAIAYLQTLDDASLPGLIVLDLNMPIMNGTQTLLHLKQEPRFQKIPVVIFSTSNNDQEKTKCLSSGAVDYLVKPMTYEEGQIVIQKFMLHLSGQLMDSNR